MLFYNALIGLVGAFLRILFSAVFGMLLIFRVDRVVLMKGFEFFDFGKFRVHVASEVAYCNLRYYA